MKQLHRIALGMGGLFVTTLFASTAVASPYSQTNLVSDIAGLAQLTDTSLKNPWGMSFNAASPFWVSNQGSNTTNLFRITNGAVSQVTAGGATTADIAIPTIAGGPNGPTGQVFNSAGAGTFVVGTAASNFIFANLNGTISAWNASAANSAQVKVTTPGAVYTGLAISGAGAAARLFAANSAGTGSIDVFDSTFAKVTTTGGFVDADPRLAGLVPFNVTTTGGKLYVTYAVPGRPGQIAATSGQGAVAVFDTNGTLLQTLIAGAGDHLASPWGVALAPSNFGQFSNDLLVGNFSFALSEINAFDPNTGAFLGTIADLNGNALIASPFATNGLWAIEFGNGVTASSNALLFAAGINGEADGLIGAITAIPEPESFALLGIGAIAMLLGARRRRS